MLATVVVAGEPRGDFGLDNCLAHATVIDTPAYGVRSSRCHQSVQCDHSTKVSCPPLPSLHNALVSLHSSGWSKMYHLSTLASLTLG